MPRYNKGLFLFNGNAGKEEIEPQLNQTLPIIAQSVKELNVIQTESVAELKRVCKEYGPTVDLLVILGGDGTVHECINSLAELDQRPVIGILPGGTCNDFSRMLEIPQNLNSGGQGFSSRGRTSRRCRANRARVFPEFLGHRISDTNLFQY